MVVLWRKERTSFFFTLNHYSCHFSVCVCVCCVHVCEWFHSISFVHSSFEAQLCCVSFLSVVDVLSPTNCSMKSSLSSGLCSFYVGLRRRHCFVAAVIVVARSIACSFYRLVFGFHLHRFSFVSLVFVHSFARFAPTICTEIVCGCVRRQNAIQSHNPMWKDAKEYNIITFTIISFFYFVLNK